MKINIIFLTILILNGCQNQKEMNQTELIKETVIQLFVHSDNKDWDGVEAQFAPLVHLDYSSMSGNPATKLKPKEIANAWEIVLPGFTHTHHQIGNVLVDIKDNKAHVYCYGTATHYLEDENGNVWTVVGSYDFDLEKVDEDWRITSMVFNYKYQDGNTDLVQKAIENAKSK